MEFQIVFCDVDGTLLNSSHEMLPGTLRAIRTLEARGIPFVIVSGRSPAGIEPIFKESGFRCPRICCNGAMMLDMEGRTVFSEGFSRETAGRVIQRMEEIPWECVWNLFTQDQWIVKDRRNACVALEESIVRVAAEEGGPDSVDASAAVGKIMGMCRAEDMDRIEAEMKRAFPELSIVRSSDTLLDVMQGGVSKSSAVKKACELYRVPLRAAVAFGDQFNDVQMLETVGMPFLMGNAPAELKRRFSNITDSNDAEGICRALEKLGLNIMNGEEAK